MVIIYTIELEPLNSALHTCLLIKHFIYAEGWLSVISLLSSKPSGPEAKFLVLDWGI